MKPYDVVLVVNRSTPLGELCVFVKMLRISSSEATVCIRSQDELTFSFVEQHKEHWANISKANIHSELITQNNWK
jgi:hypothetical protein